MSWNVAFTDTVKLLTSIVLIDANSVIVAVVIFAVLIVAIVIFAVSIVEKLLSIVAVLIYEEVIEFNEISSIKFTFKNESILIFVPPLYIFVVENNIKLKGSVPTTTCDGSLLCNHAVFLLLHPSITNT